MISIRQAKTDDLAALSQMWLKLNDYLQEYGSTDTVLFYTEAFRKVIGYTRPGVALVAEDTAAGHTKVVGGLLAMDVGPTSFGRTVRGLGTYVEPGYRGRGVAKRLYEVAIEDLKLQGFDAYLGAYHEGNKQGRKLLESMGAKVVQVVTCINLGS